VIPRKSVLPIILALVIHAISETPPSLGKPMISRKLEEAWGMRTSR